MPTQGQGSALELTSILSPVLERQKGSLEPVPYAAPAPLPCTMPNSKAPAPLKKGFGCNGEDGGYISRIISQEGNSESQRVRKGDGSDVLGRSCPEAGDSQGDCLMPRISLFTYLCFPEGPTSTHLCLLFPLPRIISAAITIPLQGYLLILQVCMYSFLL